MPELKAEVRVRFIPNQGWEARLSWGEYMVQGIGNDCAEAVADLLHNLSDFAPSWLLQETAKAE